MRAAGVLTRERLLTMYMIRQKIRVPSSRSRFAWHFPTHVGTTHLYMSFEPTKPANSCEDLYISMF